MKNVKLIFLTIQIDNLGYKISTEITVNDFTACEISAV